MIDLGPHFGATWCPSEASPGRVRGESGRVRGESGRLGYPILPKTSPRPLQDHPRLLQDPSKTPQEPLRPHPRPPKNDPKTQPANQTNQPKQPTKRKIGGNTYLCWVLGPSWPQDPPKTKKYIQNKILGALLGTSFGGQNRPKINFLGFQEVLIL